MGTIEIINSLNIKPHPEGGWYLETWRGDKKPRAAGNPMEQHIYQHGVTRIEIRWPDITSAQHPQRIVPKGAWQKTIPQKGWVLVGCTVSPRFEFDGFEMAPQGWAP